VLDNIEGVGPKRKKELIRHFGSVKAIKRLSRAKLRKLKESAGIWHKKYMNGLERSQCVFDISHLLGSSGGFIPSLRHKEISFEGENVRYLPTPYLQAKYNAFKRI